MAYCPECNEQWEPSVERCPVCGKSLTASDEQESDWVMLGTIANKPTADLAKEVLKSSGVPVVVISRSGFFGNIGLTLDSFYSGRPGVFELSIPREYRQEASDILEMTLGAEWNQGSA